MANRTVVEGISAREGRTYLDVSHGTDTVSFVSPLFGYNTYFSVGDAITQAGLEKPTMAQNASLAHAAWQNPREKYSADIIEKMRSNWLWSFNGIFYVPKEGAYIQDRPAIVGNVLSMSRDELVKKLESRDSSVRFVPFADICTGQLSDYSDLAKNKFVIALAGAEGADKLAETASHYRRKPYVWALTETASEQKRVASLSSDWDDYYRLFVYGGRLDVDGYRSGSVDFGCAFGVSPASELAA